MVVATHFFKVENIPKNTHIFSVVHGNSQENSTGWNQREYRKAVNICHHLKNPLEKRLSLAFWLKVE